MPIREESFRIGCGRYIQGKGYIEKCGEEVLRLGTSPYLHGEVVGIGLLLQNHFNGEAENNDFLFSLMKKYNMPYTLSDIGVTMTDEYLEKYYIKLCSGSAIDETNHKECENLRKGLEYLRNIK